MRAHQEKNRILSHVVSTPFIYIVLLPLVVLDITVEVYHHICFPLYGIKLVSRARYIKVDRHKLSKIDLVAKINCTYCGYANGLLAYVSEITARTEEYWCSIRHQSDDNFVEPRHHVHFEDYESYI